MNLAPELKQERREAVPRPPSRVYPRMTAAAKRKEPPQDVYARPPVMDEDIVYLAATAATIAVPFERLVA